MTTKNLILSFTDIKSSSKCFGCFKCNAMFQDIDLITSYKYQNLKNLKAFFSWLDGPTLSISLLFATISVDI